MKNDMVGRRWGALAALVALAGCGGDDGAMTMSASGTSSAMTTSTSSTGDPPTTTETSTSTASSGGSGGETDSMTTAVDPTTTTTTAAATDTTIDTSPGTDTETMSTGPQPSCGDGVVDDGEGCDDGNNDPGDGCSASCAVEGCGNGVLDPGEGCDDGNDSNTDACVEGCKAASCGDGFVQAGVEACDDGNQVDTDACLSTCEAATCGDGIIHEGVEGCDDGNLVEGDGCTSKCNVPEACDDVLADAPGAADGVYIIAPMGAEPFPVWCDMSTDGGGWTLAYATREFRSKDTDPRVHFQDLANSSIIGTNGEPMMFGHAVRASAEEVMWRCSPDGVIDKWWVAGTPSYMLNQSHQVPPQPLTYLRKSANATRTPAFFIEGSNNFPNLGYFMINTTPLSCTAADAVWGGYCFSYNCNGPAQSGLCIRSACDGVDVSNGADPARRFWIYYR